MNNIKDDSYYLQKIRKDLEFIIVHMENVEETDFETILNFYVNLQSRVE